MFKPEFPSAKELTPYLKHIKSTGRLTNCGSLHERLERDLSLYLGQPRGVLVSSCTIGLMLALKDATRQAVREGRTEVITSPYSFIATRQAIEWCGLTPVFVDTGAYGLISQKSVDAAITDKTAAIMPVNVYGQTLEVTSKLHPVIYDNAHGFGLDTCYGDYSVISLHATKVFNAVEGGIIFCKDKYKADNLRSMRNFGEIGGLNGKMSELHAAVGLINLENHKEYLFGRRVAFNQYFNNLKMRERLIWSPNCSYLPYRSVNRNEIYGVLTREGVACKKYFDKLLCVDHDKQNYPNAKYLSETVLCLPWESKKNILKICEIINKIDKNLLLAE